MRLMLTQLWGGQNIWGTTLDYVRSPQQKVTSGKPEEETMMTNKRSAEKIVRDIRRTDGNLRRDKFGDRYQ